MKTKAKKKPKLTDEQIIHRLAECGIQSNQIYDKALFVYLMRDGCCLCVRSKTSPFGQRQAVVHYFLNAKD